MNKTVQRQFLITLTIFTIICGFVLVQPTVAAKQISRRSPIWAVNGKKYHVANVKQVTVQYRNGSKAQKRYFDEAMKRWNKTNVVHFKKVKKAGAIKVTFHKGLAKTNVGAGGVTLLSTDYYTGTIVKDTIEMYPKRTHMLGGRKIAYITADTHELGHAIGLQHDPDVNSVMHATTLVNRSYPITKANLNAVRYIYNER